MDNKGFHLSEESSFRLKLTRISITRDELEIKGHRDFVRSNSSITVEEDQIVFSWEDITVVPKKDSQKQKSSFFESCNKGSSKPGLPNKIILNEANGIVRPGELVAIMGASGAGKSTLLNSLTYRNLEGLEILSGVRYANGVPVNPTTLTAVSAYVQQDDLFIGTLTVRETLQFQARVRMAENIPDKLRLDRVESVMEEHGLTKCADTLIGIPGRMRGISGGEMKRLAFACEILTNPPLFFCDEPTSGLDSYMAQNVVQVLRTLAGLGKTIVCTIHQPSSQVFSLFDRVLLMAEGRLAFLGGKDQIDKLFTRMGYPCPMNYNPSDHYVKVLAVKPSKEKECRERIQTICDEFKKSNEGNEILSAIGYERTHPRSIPHPDGGVVDLATGGKTSPYRSSWLRQFKAVLIRSTLSVWKEPMLIQVRIFQTILISTVLGVIYLGQDYRDPSSVQNINGALFLVLTNMSFGNVFPVINTFCVELPVFLREHFNGMYRCDVYFLSKMLADLPIFIFTSILFMGIFYYLVGFNEAVDRFLIATAIVTLVVQVVVSFGYFISCLSPNQQVALTITVPMIIPLLLFGGFFLNSESIPGWLAWFQYLSWYKYGNELLIINQWSGVEFDCNNETVVEECLYTTGEQVIDVFGFEKSRMAFDFGMLFVMMIVLRLIAFGCLISKTFRKH